MKKLILAGLMAFSAMGSVNAGGFGEGIGGGILGGALITGMSGGFGSRGERVVVQDRGAQRELDRVYRENDQLRRRLERLEEKMEKRGR